LKKYILLIVIALLLSGCSIPNTVKEDQIPTSGKIVVGKKEYGMITGEYSYQGKGMKMKKINKKSARDFAKDFDNLSVKKDTIIEIVIEDNPSLTVKEWKENGEITEVTISNNKITVPSQPGNYIYEVIGTWPRGEATFIFDVDVVE
jgi:Prokaryotic membrane lipoprotein lipid attachment site